jgi:hypothetical protein
VHFDHQVGRILQACGIGDELRPLPRPDALTRRWFAERDVTWALQRPDFYLYGAATNAADASGLLRNLRSRL